MPPGRTYYPDLKQYFLSNLTQLPVVRLILPQSGMDDLSLGDILKKRVFVGKYPDCVTIILAGTNDVLNESSI